MGESAEDLNRYCTNKKIWTTKEYQNTPTIIITEVCINSTRQFSQSCPTLRPHEPQHTRPPCPSPTPGVYSNSCPLSQWCLQPSSPTCHLQSFPASGSFQMNQIFTSGGQSIEISASTPVLPVNIQGWIPLGWAGWIFLQSKGLTLKSLLQHHSLKASIFWPSAFFMIQFSHP